MASGAKEDGVTPPKRGSWEEAEYGKIENVWTSVFPLRRAVPSSTKADCQASAIMPVSLWDIRFASILFSIIWFAALSHKEPTYAKLRRGWRTASLQSEGQG